jgi:uncharacterized protein
LRYLTFWQGAIALTIVPLLHWTILGRTLGVSGHFTAIVDSLRQPKKTAEGDTPMNEAELLAAIRAETSAAFGSEAIEEPSARAPAAAPIWHRRPDSLGMHLFFLAGLALGGFVSTVVAGPFVPSLWLRGELFANFVGRSSVSHVLVPLAGGLLIGFGTRMAGGCTSGHGLCGISQFQPGSLVATIGFFGMGVVVSFLIGALS